MLKKDENQCNLFPIIPKGYLLRINPAGLSNRSFAC